MGKGGAPTPPDPKQVAGDQTSTNIGTAIASNHMRMMNQNTPWGSLTFNRVGGGRGGVPVQRPVGNFGMGRPERPAILDDTAKSYFSRNSEKYWGTGGGDSREDGGIFAAGSFSPNNRAEFERKQAAARAKYQSEMEDWREGGGNRVQRGMRGGGGGSGDMVWNDPVTGKSYVIPQYESTMTLNPQLQRALDAQFKAGRRLSGQIAANAKTRIKAPRLEETYNVETRDRVEQALMDRLNPYIDRDRERLDTRLINQGIMPGAEQRDARVDEFNRGVNDARLGAIINAGNEARADAGFTNNARLAEFQARQQALNDPINRLSAILGAGQVAAPPVQQIAPEGISPVDYGGYVYDSAGLEMEAYKQQMANQRSMMSGLFGLAGKFVG